MSKSAVLQYIGISAANAGDAATAMRDFRKADKLDQIPSDSWMKLGLALDRHGKRDEAYAAYRKGSGFLVPGSEGQDPQMQEAFARFGIMCGERGLHQDAVLCYNAGRKWEMTDHLDLLAKTLDARNASSKSVRMMLDLVLGDALEGEKAFGLFDANRGTEALAAFQSAIRLAPNDPRCEYILAEYLRRAKRYSEAQTALKRASRLDKAGKLREETAKSLGMVKARYSH